MNPYEATRVLYNAEIRLGREVTKAEFETGQIVKLEDFQVVYTEVSDYLANIMSIDHAHLGY